MRHSSGFVFAALLVLVCAFAMPKRRGASFLGLMATQTAIEDWTAKYPLDPWIAPREYRLSRLFAGLRSHDGNAEAARCRVFLRAHFPKARYK